MQPSRTTNNAFGVRPCPVSEPPLASERGGCRVTARHASAVAGARARHRAAGQLLESAWRDSATGCSTLARISSATPILVVLLRSVWRGLQDLFQTKVAENGHQ